MGEPRITRVRSAALRWVQRNEDKPHRCPECHSVRTWDRRSYGPRTRLTCPPCGVQWRVGNRCRRDSMRLRYPGCARPLAPCPVRHSWRDLSFGGGA